MKDFVCERCGNSDPKYIGYRNNEPYCRFCISMVGAEAKKNNPIAKPTILRLAYPLSKEQKNISEKLIQNYDKKFDSLINAVCGAGKTELVYHLIAHCLSQGKTVAFAVPRRDVVIELFMRIKEVFPYNKIVAVYGEHASTLEGDVIVLTTHQFYRYKYYFDLIILDEIDAFPFSGNKLLYKMFTRAKKGPVVLMSATPSKEVLSYFSRKNRDILELNTRFHRHPLPVPEVVVKIGCLKVIWLINKLKKLIKDGKKIFVFTPTINDCEKLFKTLNKFIKNGNYVHSKRGERNQIISDFKNLKYDYLITTAVLERGVTIKNLQVIIYDADHKLYNSQALIQISGRVGRKIDAPEGEVVFLVDKSTKEIENAIQTIKSKNENL